MIFKRTSSIFTEMINFHGNLWHEVMSNDIHNELDIYRIGLGSMTYMPRIVSSQNILTAI